MTTFDDDLAEFVRSVAEKGLAQTEGSKVIVFRIPEAAFPAALEALERAAATLGTQSAFTTLWALLEPYFPEGG